jgi:oligoendopeptidase F
MTTLAETGAENVEWDLRDLYESPADARWRRDADEALRAAEAFRLRYAGGVAALGPDELVDATDDYERIVTLMFRVWLFAKLASDTDTTDSEPARLLQLAVERQTAVENELLFFKLEWAAVDEEKARAVLDDRRTKRYANFLRVQRRFRDHLLSEAEERVAAEKELGGVKAWARLNTNLLAEIRVRFEGEEMAPLAALQRLRVTPDRDTRRRLAEALGHALERNIATRASVLNAVATDRAVEDRLRRYPTWVSHRNLENEIADDAVEALIDAVLSRSDIPRRHFRLRARLLGLPRLADYDRTAPVGDEAARISWQEARELLISTYSAFSPITGEIVRRMFERDHIDAAPRAGKAASLYCSFPMPGTDPYILITYTGSRRSALVLAHELGHAIHFAFASERGYLNAQVPLTLAETASVLGEALVFDALLERAETPRRRLDLLVERLDDMIGTSFGAVAANRFEHAVHAEHRDQGELSATRVNELWLDAHTAFHGDAVEATAGFGAWWSFRSQFVWLPGYMYAYAFGFLLSLSVYHRYLEQGTSLVEPILDLLRAGRSVPTEQLVRRVGIDLDDPALWHRALDLLDDHLSEAESLAAHA